MHALSEAERNAIVFAIMDSCGVVLRRDDGRVHDPHGLDVLWSPTYKPEDIWCACDAGVGYMDLDAAALFRQLEPVEITKSAVPVNMKMICSQCDARKYARNLKKCTRCQVARYCNEACQRAHWRAGHRSECTDVGSSS